ncbi:hypothetical protein [Treponema sp.]|uniref:hypothetical protein n=1 Tax=Treponema sp. TaxID=166 RepID=UPI00257B8600|nr:hypothetical protein [Treponema sp.]MBE6353668.1 hypothetical protein [Treponema sp.]
MKRILKALAVSILAFSAFGVMSCKDAIVDDGTNIKSYVSSSGGAGGAVPFHMYNDKMDLQIWADNGGGANATPTKEELIITQTGSWWGMAICSNAAGDDSTDKYKIYDMSEVAKVTFYAKSDKATSIWLSGVSDANKKSVSITDEYPEEPYEVPFTTKIDGYHYAIVCIGGESADATWYVKNIAFFDDSGNEIVPTVK